MDLRSPVKNALRMCGHAAVSTVHDRLNGIERTLEEIVEQNTELAATQTALLQSGVHVVEALARIQEEIQRAEVRLIERILEECAAKSDLKEVARALASSHAALLEQTAALTARTEQRVNAAGCEIQEQLHAIVDAALPRIDARLQEALAAAAQQIDARLQEALAAAAQQTDGRLQEAVAAAAQPDEARIREALSGAVAPALERMLQLSDGVRQTVSSSLALLEPYAHQTNAFLANESVRQVCVETSDYVSLNPELGLFAFLYSWLPSGKALDIGAHTGDVSEYLLRSGYEVYAFEPYPETYRRLQSRLCGAPGFHSFAFAIGSTEGQQRLHLVEDRSPDKVYGDPTVFYSLSPHQMPADLAFRNDSVNVNVRTLARLHEEGVLPADIGLVKIDTEGFDLEVIRGMEGYRYPVVMVEFWDTAIPFGGPGLRYTMDAMVAEMRARQYLWYIVIYRVWGHPHTAYFANHDRPVAHSWGNVIFFRDREIFVEAQKWCAAVLPRTYFKPVPAPAQKPQAG